MIGLGCELEKLAFKNAWDAWIVAYVSIIICVLSNQTLQMSEINENILSSKYQTPSVIWSLRYWDIFNKLWHMMTNSFVCYFCWLLSFYNMMNQTGFDVFRYIGTKNWQKHCYSFRRICWTSRNNGITCGGFRPCHII